MKLLVLAGTPGAAARVVDLLPPGNDVEVRTTASPPSPEPGAGTADVALACDDEGRAMATLLPADVPRVALVAAYGDAAGDDAHAEIDLWAVGHESVARALEARGVPKDRIAVTGVPVPLGLVPSGDRAAARTEAGLSADAAVVVVRTEVAPDDLGPLLVQLTLLEGRPWILFDVGEDVAAAERLRAEAPRMGIAAKMFAAGPEQARFLALADVIVGPADPFDVARTFAVGAAAVVIGRPTRGALDAVVDAGAVRVVLALGRLAADVDLLRAPQRLEAARAAARAAAVPDAQTRLADVLTRATTERGAFAAQRRRRGLPVGLEDLSGPAPSSPAPPRRTEKDIEDELAALRKKIGK